MARRLAFAVAVLAVSCGGEREPDFFVQGTGIIVDTAAPFVIREDFPARVERTLAAALAYWGGSWSDLEGTTITLVGTQFVACALPNAIGCNDGNIRVSTRDPSVGTWHCVEQTVLVHEVGHSVIGDPAHADPRWMDFDAVLAHLEGQTGYTEEGEVPCLLFPSVWRHLSSRL